MPFSRGPSQSNDQTLVLRVSCNWQAGSLPLAPLGRPRPHTNRDFPQSLACLGLVLRRGEAPTESLSQGCDLPLGAWLTAEQVFNLFLPWLTSASSRNPNFQGRGR